MTRKPVKPIKDGNVQAITPEQAALLPQSKNCLRTTPSTQRQLFPGQMIVRSSRL